MEIRLYQRAIDSYQIKNHHVNYTYLSVKHITQLNSILVEQNITWLSAVMKHLYIQQ